jgi:hypothetical protein
MRLAAGADDDARYPAFDVDGPVGRHRCKALVDVVVAVEHEVDAVLLEGVVVVVKKRW